MHCNIAGCHGRRHRVQEYGVEVGDSLFVLLITERAKTSTVADSRSSSEDIAPRAAKVRRSLTSMLGEVCMLTVHSNLATGENLLILSPALVVLKDGMASLSCQYG